jgi:hypothetical protein
VTKPGDPETPEPVPPPAAPAGAGAGPSPAPLATDRRMTSDRRGPDRRVKQVPVEHERRSGKDRRLEADRRGPIVETDEDLLEFLRAIHDFKERTGKAFPAWSDVLRIVRELGYEKRA